MSFYLTVLTRHGAADLSETGSVQADDAGGICHQEEFSIEEEDGKKVVDEKEQSLFEKPNLDWDTDCLQVCFGRFYIRKKEP